MRCCIPTVQLRSGGYLVINQAEALVAIDVNSGRSTRERNIEETALRTNLEAADEVARQLRLRDLAGLIVIDFIDMESKRHNAMVERRMKEALKNDRARIQIGHISHFGLLEMSRQRLRPSLAETSFMPCPHCGGTGHVRSTENAAIHVLRGIEDEGSKRRAAEIIVYVSTPVALYLLNHKRERLREIELRYVMRVVIAADDTQIAPQFRVDRVRLRSADEAAALVAPEHAIMAPPVEDVERDEEEEEEDDVVATTEDADETEATGVEPRSADAEAPEAGGEVSAEEEAERRRRKRRRRRRGGKREEGGAAREGEDEAEAGPREPAMANEDASAPVEAAHADAGAEAAEGAVPGEAGEAPVGDDDPRNRRRGRRGGRRRRRDGEGDISPLAVPGAEQPDLLPVYAGPTPADPFGGQAFDIFDVMDQAERQAEILPPPRLASSAEIFYSGEATAGAEPAAEQGPSGTPEEAAPAVHEMPPAAPEDVNANSAEPDAAALSESAVAIDQQSRRDSESTTVLEAEMAEAGVPAPANDVAALDAGEPPRPEPLVKPVLVGAGGEPPAERKRGWWRR